MPHRALHAVPSLLARLAVITSLTLAACPRPQDYDRNKQDAPSPRDAPVRQDQRPSTDLPAGPSAKLADGTAWSKCDGSLSLQDIPDTPLTAVVAGKKLNPTAQVARASVLGRSISFDFVQPTKFNKDTPCFIAEAHLFAGFKRETPDYAQSIVLPSGQYRLGESWKAYYGYQSAQGKRTLRHPAFYGLLVLETATGLGVKSKRMFAPTGRVKGKVAICFKDDKKSWIAGAFDIPACGDAAR